MNLQLVHMPNRRKKIKEREGGKEMRGNTAGETGAAPHNVACYKAKHNVLLVESTGVMKLQYLH